MNFLIFLNFLDFILIVQDLFHKKIAKKGYLITRDPWRRRGATWTLGEATRAHVAPTWCVMKRDREVVNCTRSRVKNNSKLTNLVKISRIEGYNGKYGSNPQGNREISDDLFEFDQIEQWIDDRNWEKWYLIKENFKTIPENQKSSNLTLILGRNWRSKWRIISEIKNRELNENKLEIKLNC